MGWLRRGSVIVLLVILAGLPLRQAPAEEDLLELDPTQFGRSTVIDNPWWPLEPGVRLVYEGHHIEDGEEIPHQVVDTVTDLTKMVNGVRTVISLEQDFRDDVMIEQEIAFHAQDDAGNVWHLGQLRETYDETEFVGARVWLVGHTEGAHAGIRMLADPQPGDTYSQGYAPEPYNWTDRARVVELGLTTEVTAGRYENVLLTEEWDEETPEGVFQTKYYAQGVGVVRIGYEGPDPEQEELELVRVERLSADEMAEVREVVRAIEERSAMYGTLPPAEPNPDAT